MVIVMPEKTVLRKNRYKNLDDLRRITVFSSKVVPKRLSKKELRMKLK